jgi:protein-tyrosine-phosphatase
VGVFYAALCVCTTFIFLDRRENTFCIPMHCGSSMLSGVAAAAVLTAIYHQKATSVAQFESAGLIVVALAFLSPLHHVKDRLWSAFGRYRPVQVAGSSALVLPRPAILEAQPAEEGYIGKLRRVFLFVCSGNTCRSPMAEAIGNAEIARRLRIPFESFHKSHVHSISAGVTARPGSPMTQEAVEALQSLSVAIKPHASRPLTAELVDGAEVVYCMSQSHRDAVLDIVPSAAAKTRCLDPDGDVDDPIGGGPDVYMSCARRIQALVSMRLDEAGIIGGSLVGASD